MEKLNLTRSFLKRMLVCCALLLLLAGTSAGAYAVEGGNISGWRLASPEAANPNPPTNLTATAATQTQIDLSWEDNSDETEFRIERSPNGTASWAEIATVGAGVISYSDTGLTCGTAYYYRVRAYRSGDGKYSAYSNVADDTTNPCPPPVAPTGLSATPISQTQIDLTWTDNSADESEFRIERSPNGSSSWAEIATVGPDVTTYSHTGLTCGTSHFYRVRAYRSGDGQFSNYSNVGTATTNSCPPPDAPTGLSATTFSLTQIDLSWTDNSDDETYFSIERSPNGTTGWTEIYTATADATSYSDTGLTCGTLYYYLCGPTGPATDNTPTTATRTAPPPVPAPRPMRLPTCRRRPSRRPRSTSAGPTTRLTRLVSP